VETLQAGLGRGTSPDERNRPSPIFVGLVALWTASGWAAWTGSLTSKYAVFAFVIVGWIVSLCIHEYGHARTAYWGGDKSVAGRGYLTLDPRKYVDPGLSLILPLVFLLMGGIGLPGGAVYVQAGSIRTRWQRSLMSAAGPLTNISLGVLGGLVFTVAPGTLAGHTAFAAALAFLVRLQFVAAILNLLPLPGLDGFGIIEPYLSRDILQAIAPYRRYTMLLLFFVAFQSQAFSNLVFGNANRISEAFKIPYDLIYLGHDLFMFWR
jgi:Zn-dependent protease